jgi:hypothetical protein
MCDTQRVTARIPRPGWGGLYAIVVAAFAACAAVELAVPGPALQAAGERAIAAVAFAVMVQWVWVNRVAFDLLDWCACASKSVTVRVITSERSRRPPGDAEPEEAERGGEVVIVGAAGSDPHDLADVVLAHRAPDSSRASATVEV